MNSKAVGKVEFVMNSFSQFYSSESYPWEKFTPQLNGYIIGDKYIFYLHLTLLLTSKREMPKLFHQIFKFISS